MRVKVVTCADGRDVKIRLEDWWALYELSTLGLRSMAGTRDCHHRTPTDSLQSQGSTNHSIRDIDYGCAFSFSKNFPAPPPMMSFWWNQLLTDLWVCSLIPNARIYITAKDELLPFCISVDSGPTYRGWKEWIWAEFFLTPFLSHSAHCHVSCIIHVNNHVKSCAHAS